MKKLMVGILLIGVLVWSRPDQVEADGCSATISPTTFGAGSVSLHLNVSNASDQVAWIMIASPENAGYAITDATTTSSLAPNTVRAEWAIFLGGPVSAGESLGFDLTADVSGDVGASGTWGVVVANDVDGNNTTTCTGTLSTSLIDPTESTTPPTISNANLTVGNSSATLTWNTNFASTGVVNYGTSSGYGSSVTTASGTSHSATMSNLSPSTTYHYQIQAIGEGGTTSTADATFTTSAASVTTTTTTTVTNTVTNTATVNKTVILADTVKPVVKVNSLQRTANGVQQEAVYDKAPIIEGKVVDSGAVNVGIVKVQYSTDGGKSWLLVDEPSGASKVEFSFVPEVYDDGNYQILVRATDKSGNTGMSSAQTLIIDRLPPRIIHSLWRVGPIILSAPYQLVPDVPVQVSVQAVGGVTEMKLEIGNSKFELIKNSETGLWENEIVLEEAGQWKIIVKAKDGGGNEIEQNIGNVDMRADNNLPLQGTQTTIYRYDELIHRFKVWNGEVYGQENPSMGKQSWYLPSGKYYIEAKARGYKTAQTEIFDLDIPGVVGVEGGLAKWGWGNWWKRGKLGIWKQEVGIRKQELVGKQITWLEKTEWRGKEIDLMVLPIWEPRLAEILGGLKEDSLVVIPGANQSSVKLLRDRGEYKMKLVGDPDGEILSDLAGESLPINMIINRRGQVE